MSISNNNFSEHLSRSLKLTPDTHSLLACPIELSSYSILNCHRNTVQTVSQVVQFTGRGECYLKRERCRHRKKNNFLKPFLKGTILRSGE